MNKIIFIFIFSILIYRSYSWHAYGHILTAQFAKNELQSSNIEIFNYFNEMSLLLNSLTDGKSNTFVESAVWPDDIKKDQLDFFDSWHFYDRFFSPEGFSTNGDSKYNAIYALDKVKEILSNPKINKNHFSKAIMIRFI